MDEAAPFFSVVIPVYNKKPHVQRSITSVVGQTFSDFELIIIDDASTDGSLDEIRKFIDPRIRLFHRDKPGPGGYAARNLGIKVARGELVAFLDADDEWYPDHLKKMFDLSEKYPNVLFLACGYEIRNGTNRHCNKYFELNNKRGDHLINLSDYFQSCIDNNAPACTDVVCISKAISKGYAIFPEEKHTLRGGDLHAWLKIMCYYKRMAWSNHIGANYYTDSINMVTKTAYKSYEVMGKENFQDLWVLVNATEKKKLARYLNLRLKKAIIGNLKICNHIPVSWRAFYWRYDFSRSLFMLVLILLPKKMWNVLLPVLRVFKLYKA